VNIASDHQPRAATAPRAIPIQLDAIVIGIPKIERLADPVVRGAVERDARLQDPAERIGQLRALRVQDGEVIQPRAAWRRR
jgi:hypothetical protein